MQCNAINVPLWQWDAITPIETQPDPLDSSLDSFLPSWVHDTTNFQVVCLPIWSTQILTLRVQVVKWLQYRSSWTLIAFCWPLQLPYNASVKLWSPQILPCYAQCPICPNYLLHCGGGDGVFNRRLLSAWLPNCLSPVKPTSINFSLFVHCFVDITEMNWFGIEALTYILQENLIENTTDKSTS